MNQETLKEVSAKISQANNVLVAVSSNPTVDQLSASVGLTLLLNKLGKHATTVFSGVVPSTLEFLQPEQAIEKTTDSLRDFIIALDKSKADKLRYKVEDDVVRIFITPYKTTITDKDLDFSLGEFNVDVVIAVGISKRDDVDQAVTAHGRILHDATVVALTNKEGSDFGAINWNQPNSSSICEMVTAVAYEIAKDSIDGQMATALLTGIISETDRFRNESTTPQSLEFASHLMSAGANQQLIADELEAAVKLQQTDSMAQAEELPMPHDEYNVPQPLDHKEDDGSLQIDHPEESAEDTAGEVDNIHIDHHGNLLNAEDVSSDEGNQTEQDRHDSYLEPPSPDQTQSDSVFNLEDTQIQDTQSEQGQPTLTHGKTITPINEPEFPSTPPEPFDAQKALSEMQQSPDQSETSSSQVGGEDQQMAATPQDETQVVGSEPAPEINTQVPEQQLNNSIPQPLDQTPSEPEPPVQANDASNNVPSPVVPDQTLKDLEESFNSPHLSQYQDSSGQGHPNEQPQDASMNQPATTDAIPKPLDENESQDAPPPVPPPMQPQFFDPHSS